MSLKDYFFTTGEFARLCNVSKDTLFHYDDKGVFSPAHTSDNGYRQYSAAQYDVLSVILCLRDLGMPLGEIKRYMDERSPERLLALLEQQEGRIDARIAQLCEKKRVLGGVAAGVRECLSATGEEVFRSVSPPQKLLLSDPITAYEDAEILRSMAQVVQKSCTLAAACHYMLGGIRRAEDMRAGRWERYLYFYLRLIEPAEGVEAFCKPGGAYLVTYHRGDWESIGAAYQRLLAYAQEHALEVGEVFYEEGLVDHMAVFDDTEYVSRISIQLQEAQKEKHFEGTKDK